MAGGGCSNIDALIAVYFEPDYFMPKLSNIIAHKLGFNSNVLCIDNFNFCNGFVSALAQSAMLLEYLERVAIVCVNVSSKSIDPQDKQFMAITTDSASAVIVEKSKEKMYFLEEVFLDKMFEMSTLVSAYKNGDKKLRSNNNLLLKEFSKNIVPICKKLAENSPKADIYFAHMASAFFQNTLEKQCEIKIFNEALEKYGCLYLNDLTSNLILAKEKFNFTDKKRAQFIGYGTGLTISVANMPIFDFDSKIVFV